MPAVKRKPKPDSVWLEERIKRARMATPPRPTHLYVLAAELAARVGVNPGDVMDDLDHAAAVREYDGGVTREEAEKAAWLEVEERYTRQRRIL